MLNGNALTDAYRFACCLPPLRWHACYPMLTPPKIDFCLRLTGSLVRPISGKKPPILINRRALRKWGSDTERERGGGREKINNWTHQGSQFTKEKGASDFYMCVCVCVLYASLRRGKHIFGKLHERTATINPENSHQSRTTIGRIRRWDTHSTPLPNIGT